MEGVHHIPFGLKTIQGHLCAAPAAPLVSGRAALLADGRFHFDKRI
jgi:hypothetical protein